MWRRLFPLFLLCIGLSQSAFGFERNFPLDAKRGELKSVAFPQVTINGKARQLSMGAQIRNQSNQIELPSAITASNVPVVYVENSLGEIHRVWLLTPEEANRKPPRP